MLKRFSTLKHFQIKHNPIGCGSHDDALLFKIVGGEIFPESKDDDDDPLQMGGDFTITRSGSQQ